MLYIGIDLGTSAVKLLLMDGGGNICKIVSREYPLSFPEPGWSEQNPEDWLRQTVEGIRELTADCDRSQIAGIGCGGQMHGLVALDEEDRVIVACSVLEGYASAEIGRMLGMNPATVRSRKARAMDRLRRILS